jgi:membrane protease YdiL (CAAX protease family)
MPETMPTVSVPAALLMVFVFLSILTAWISVVIRLATGLPVLPPRTPRYVPWGVGSIVLAILTWLGLQIFVPTIYLVAIHHGQGRAVPRSDLSPGEQMALSAIINALVLVFIPLGLRLTCGARPRDLELVSEGLSRQIFRGVVAYPLLAPIIFGAMLGSLLIWNKTNHPLEDAIKIDHSPGMLTVLVLAGVVFAPLAEELIFRGVLLGWLTRLVIGRSKPGPSDEFFDEPEHSTFLKPTKAQDPTFADALNRDPYNPYAPPITSVALQSPNEIATEISTSKSIMLILANVVVSLIFAALHAAVWPTPIPIFFLSLGLGLLYQRTGSLVPSMVLHMTFNGVSTLLMLLMLGAPAPKEKEAPKPLAPAKVDVKAAASIVRLKFFSERTH